MFNFINLNSNILLNSMWEKDRQLLKAFRECYANLATSMTEGEDVDVAGTCVEETEALTAYTVSVIDYYKGKHPSEMSDKKARFFTPKLPYFQDF